MGAVPQLALALLLLRAMALTGPADADEGLWRRLAAGGQVVARRLPESETQPAFGWTTVRRSAT
jgi:hypothetical protein